MTGHKSLPKSPIHFFGLKSFFSNRGRSHQCAVFHWPVWVRFFLQHKLPHCRKDGRYHGHGLLLNANLSLNNCRFKTKLKMTPPQLSAFSVFRSLEESARAMHKTIRFTPEKRKSSVLKQSKGVLGHSELLKDHLIPVIRQLLHFSTTGTIEFPVKLGKKSLRSRGLCKFIT